MGSPRLLVVHAHPDDESMWTGGLLAKHVRAGGEADLVMCTWDAGTPRHGELLRAVEILGLPRPPILLRYADDRVPASAPGRERFCAAGFDEQVRTLAGHIRELRPDVVVTYDAFGIYGHPDHVHANRLTCAAVDAAACGTLYQRNGAPWQVRSLYFATIPIWMIEMIADDIFAGVSRTQLPGTPENMIDVHLDVADVVEQKTAAIAAHQTEIDRSRTIAMFFALPDDKRDRLLGSENYLRRDLVPGGCDLT
ncbi:PIG-L family deacetylase [Gordonia sp. ABSL1-1]|uniref:PIG-L family deacetylase n=1 Tax=Gordonia sp. ABSL1-1 TaxID=3053923 RepID=UPI0025730BED|nr:PIG-L family deacetylase [Gordonia sp. ABSL1-1]MDL9936445.1 PIG-L family deacetylase [Gordonia sp. ABSL1-1]